MTAIELQKFKSALEARQSELRPLSSKRDGIMVEKTPDELDDIQLATQRDLVIRNLQRESELLRDVRAALARIGDASYGICVQCEGEISHKRLVAVPWTPRCIACQEQADRERRIQDQDWNFENAA